MRKLRQVDMGMRLLLVVLKHYVLDVSNGPEVPKFDDTGLKKREHTSKMKANLGKVQVLQTGSPAPRHCFLPLGLFHSLFQGGDPLHHLQ